VVVSGLPNITPIFIRNWLIKITMVLVFLILEVYGPESSGKTTLTLHVIAEMQKLGGTAAFIDAEHALDPQYAKRLGVNTDELLISHHPKT
jgi:RecA/RadA recombinase